MTHHRPTLVAFRGYIAAVWLALLAGCHVPTPPPLSAVAAPTNVVAIAGNASITLTWTASVGGAGSYRVKRSFTNGGPYLAVVSTTATTYTDSSLNNGTTYYYVVSALDAEGEGVDSAQASATPQAPTAPPVVPANLAATAGNTQISLTWTASPGAASYNVKRSSTSGGPYTQIASPTTNAYTNTGLVNDTEYYYVVSAINVVGESANSAEINAVPVVQNPPPTTFGTWIDVTPAGIDLASELCSNFGTRTVQTDPVAPSNLYTMFDCHGVYRSTDYGLTWTGPINTGTNGTLIGECSGGITLSRTGAASVPTLYAGCIRGGGVGFWKSVDGGVNWTQFVVGLVPFREDYYPPVVDPYDDQHLLMASHEFQAGLIVESTNGGQTWAAIPLATPMQVGGRSPTIVFINTGNATTTRGTWLWTGDFGSGLGTYRTANSGVAWTKVDNNEYIGATQIYQPNSNGIVFTAGSNGVSRSINYGQTWSRVGLGNSESVVFATPTNVYTMFGFPFGPGVPAAPTFQVAAQPGTGTWVPPGTPAGMLQGPGQVAVVNDGTNNILVGAMWNSGLWRYVEP